MFFKDRKDIDRLFSCLGKLLLKYKLIKNYRLNINQIKSKVCLRNIIAYKNLYHNKKGKRVNVQGKTRKLGKKSNEGRYTLMIRKTVIFSPICISFY